MTLVAHFRRVCFPLFLVASVLTAYPALAITMDVSAGFDGVSKSNVWTPVAVRLVNASNDDVEGTILIKQPRNSASLPLCTSVVDLPANSEKLYHSYVRIAGYGNEFEVVVADGSRVLASKKVTVNNASVDDRLIVSVGDRSSRLAYLQNETIPVKAVAPSSPYSHSSSGTATVHVGSVLPKSLPDRPAAYEGVSVLVASELDAAAVSPNALKALGMWVASGGTMVISAGADYRRFTNDFYSELLPVNVEGAANITGAAGMSALGGAPFPAGPVAVTKTSVKPGVGRTIVEEGGVPLVVERSYGVGRVIFLAFDYKSSPFRDWSGQRDFWKSIICDPVGRPMVESITISPEEYRNYQYYGYGAMQLGMMNMVSQNPSVKMPSFATIGFFLISYLIVLVPVNYFVLRKKRRLELAWVTTPAIVILFTVGAYAIGHTMKGSELRLREAVVIEGSSGARYARMVSNASLFSPARRTYDVRVSDASVISQPVTLAERESSEPALMGGKETTLSLAMAMWSSKSLEAVGGTDLGGTLDASLQIVGDRLQGTIINNTGLSLRNCQLAYGGSSVECKDIGPGETVPVDVQFAYRTSAPPMAGSADSVSSKLYSFVQARAAQASKPVLIATTGTDSAVFELPRNRASADRGRVCVFHLDYNVGGSFQVPASAVRWQMMNAENIQNDGQPQSQLPGARASFYGYGKCVFLFQVPTPARGKITSLHLENGSDCDKVSLSIMNYKSGQWEPVVIGPGKTLPDASKYLSPGNQVRVKVMSKVGSYVNLRMLLSADGVGN